MSGRRRRRRRKKVRTKQDENVIAADLNMEKEPALARLDNEMFSLLVDGYFRMQALNIPNDIQSVISQFACPLSDRSMAQIAGTHLIARLIVDFMNDPSNQCEHLNYQNKNTMPTTNNNNKVHIDDEINILKHIYIRGGALRDCYLLRDINDVDISVDIHEVTKLYLAHLKKYHTYTSKCKNTYNFNSKCIFFRLYLKKMRQVRTVEPGSTFGYNNIVYSTDDSDFDDILNFEDYIGSCDYIINSRFIVENILHIQLGKFLHKADKGRLRFEDIGHNDDYSAYYSRPEEMEVINHDGLIGGHYVVTLNNINHNGIKINNVQYDIGDQNGNSYNLLYQTHKFYLKTQEENSKVKVKVKAKAKKKKKRNVNVSVNIDHDNSTEEIKNDVDKQKDSNSNLNDLKRFHYINVVKENNLNLDKIISDIKHYKSSLADMQKKLESEFAKYGDNNNNNHNSKKRECFIKQFKIELPMYPFPLSLKSYDFTINMMHINFYSILNNDTNINSNKYIDFNWINKVSKTISNPEKIQDKYNKNLIGKMNEYNKIALEHLKSKRIHGASIKVIQPYNAHFYFWRFVKICSKFIDDLEIARSDSNSSNSHWTIDQKYFQNTIRLYKLWFLDDDLGSAGVLRTHFNYKFLTWDLFPPGFNSKDPKAIENYKENIYRKRFRVFKYIGFDKRLRHKLSSKEKINQDYQAGLERFIRIYGLSDRHKKDLKQILKQYQYPKIQMELNSK